ncbi:MAG: hypothetical protein K0Q55_2766 [Verrucomicrobia bacterium]|jgi:hypothetical protein|nr:hypothetical protein [Verrucomicrobiota bacterium]
MLLLFFLTLAPLLVLLVTYGDRSRTACGARAVALGALAFFWLLLGIAYFGADGVEPMLRGVPKVVVAIGWVVVFAGALWGMVRNLRQAGKELAEKAVEIAKTPSAYAGPVTQSGPVAGASPAPPRPVDMKRAEAGGTGGRNKG